MTQIRRTANPPGCERASPQRLRYRPVQCHDLSKLLAKGLVERIPQSRRYRMVGRGYSICVAFRKLFEKIYAPLTAGLLKPFRGDCALAEVKRCQLDRLYQRVCDDLEALLRAVGLRVAA